MKLQNSILTVLLLAASALAAESTPKEMDKSGFKILQIEPKSIYESVGLKAGDIVTSINGKKPSSEKDLNESILGEHKSSKVKLTVIRNGQVVKLQYHVKAER